MCTRCCWRWRGWLLLLALQCVCCTFMQCSARIRNALQTDCNSSCLLSLDPSNSCRQRRAAHQYLSAHPMMGVLTRGTMLSLVVAIVTAHEAAFSWHWRLQLCCHCV
jgi:hypothetical protein